MTNITLNRIKKKKTRFQSIMPLRKRNVKNSVFSSGNDWKQGSWTSPETQTSCSASVVIYRNRSQNINCWLLLSRCSSPVLRILITGANHFCLFALLWLNLITYAIVIRIKLTYACHSKTIFYCNSWPTYICCWLSFCKSLRHNWERV
jgi:hypothetical protein